MMSNGSMMPGFVPNTTSTPRMPFAIHELLGLTGHPGNGSPQSSPNFGTCRPELPTPSSTLVQPYVYHQGTPQTPFSVASSGAGASAFPFQHQPGYHPQQNAFHSNHFLAGIDPATAAAISGFGQRGQGMGQQPMLNHDMSNGEYLLYSFRLRVRSPHPYIHPSLPPTRAESQSDGSPRGDSIRLVERCKLC